MRAVLRAKDPMPRGLRDIDSHGKRARLRAVEEPRDLKIEKDGAISVSSLSKPGARHRIEFWGRPGEIVWFTCTCPSGKYRDHLPVPCVHSAMAAQRLEVDGLCMWRSGLVYRN